MIDTVLFLVPFVEGFTNTFFRFHFKKMNFHLNIIIAGVEVTRPDAIYIDAEVLLSHAEVALTSQHQARRHGS